MRPQGFYEAAIAFFILVCTFLVALAICTR